MEVNNYLNYTKLKGVKKHKRELENKLGQKLLPIEYELFVFIQQNQNTTTAIIVLDPLFEGYGFSTVKRGINVLRDLGVLFRSEGNDKRERFLSIGEEL